MTKLSAPYRYDIVGSFLRPQELKEARAKFKAGEISQEELTKVEDKWISDLVEKEKAVGLKAVTDGEFRRSWWHLDFLWGLKGVPSTTTSKATSSMGPRPGLTMLNWAAR